MFEIILISLLVGFTSATFGVILADLWIVERRTKRTVQLIKNELVHTEPIGEMFKWWRANGERVQRDLGEFLDFLHEFAERRRKLVKSSKGGGGRTRASPNF